MEKCPGKSVGGILRRNGEIYLINRRFEPLGWACPAGHLEQGQSPEEMVRIEFVEEIHVATSPRLLLLEEFIPWNNCWRSSELGHYWYVFEMEGQEAEPSADPHEAKGGGWFSPGEIGHLELEPVWRHFFEKLGIIKPQAGWHERDA